MTGFAFLVNSCICPNKGHFDFPAMQGHAVAND